MKMTALQHPAMHWLTLAVFLLIGCGQSEQGPEGVSEGSKSDGKVQAVATVGMVADAVQVVAGEHLAVTALMEPGVDPHLYKAAQGDVRKLDESKLVFYNGLHLEGKMTEILEKMSLAKPTFAVAEVLPPDTLLTAGQGEGEIGTDPHVWFDCSLWAVVVEGIGESLAGHDPSNAQGYRERAARYAEEIRELHQWVATRIAEIPESSRVLITAHDAFEYFGRAYAVEVMGLQGLSTASEFGLNDVNRLVDTLVERKIKAVFVESSIPERSLEAVLEGCKARGHDVVIGGTLFSDAMGDSGTPEGTYPGMVRHNVNTIVDALK